MKRLKQLSIGVKSLLLTISIIMSLIVLFGSFLLASAPSGRVVVLTYYLYCIGATFGIFVIFWVITRLIIWIVDGFKK